MFAFNQTARNSAASASAVTTMAIVNIDLLSMDTVCAISAKRRADAEAATKADIAKREADAKAELKKAKEKKAAKKAEKKGSKKDKKATPDVKTVIDDVDFTVQTAASTETIVPVPAVVGSTRMELSVNNPDGTATILASVDT